jgi:hypothetical protein
MRQRSFAEERPVPQYSRTGEMAWRAYRDLVLGGSAGLAFLAALGIFDLAALRFGIGALLAAGAAYLLLGPALSMTIGLLNARYSPRA